jgi:hypothetical protein
MAKKKTGPRKKTTSRKPKIDPVFQARWTEFAGQSFDSANPAAIVSTLAKAAGAAAPLLAAAGPPIELWGKVRARRGKDCGQQAEISAFYCGDIRIVGVLGQAAVLALLNAAAAAECCKNGVQCPAVCPCHYIPQNKAAFYKILGTQEIGALLQGNNVWNCECREPCDDDPTNPTATSV